MYLASNIIPTEQVCIAVAQHLEPARFIDTCTAVAQTICMCCYNALAGNRQHKINSLLTSEKALMGCHA